MIFIGTLINGLTSYVIYGTSFGVRLVGAIFGDFRRLGNGLLGFILIRLIRRSGIIGAIRRFEARCLTRFTYCGLLSILFLTLFSVLVFKVGAR